MKLQRFCDFVGKSSVLSNQIKSIKTKNAEKRNRAPKFIRKFSGRYHKKDINKDFLFVNLKTHNKFDQELIALSKKE